MSIQVFDLDEYYEKAIPVGKRKEKVPVKGPTKTYYAIRYKGRKDEGKVGERLSSYEKEQRGIEHERMRMGSMSTDALKARAWKITDPEKMRRFYEKAQAMGRQNLADHIVQAARSKGIDIGVGPSRKTAATDEPVISEGLRFAEKERQAAVAQAEREKEPKGKKLTASKIMNKISKEIDKKFPKLDEWNDKPLEERHEFEIAIAKEMLKDSPVTAQEAKKIADHLEDENFHGPAGLFFKLARGEYEVAGQKMSVSYPEEKKEPTAGRQLRLEGPTEEEKPKKKTKDEVISELGRDVAAAALKPAVPAEEGKPKTTIPAKGEVVKPRETAPPKEKVARGKKPKPEPKRIEEFVSAASQPEFKANVKAYFDASDKISAAKATIENLLKGQEEAMGKIRPELTALDNLAKEEGKFEAKFKDDDWRYRFLSYTKSRTEWKQIAEELATLSDQARTKMAELAESLKQTTAYEKFEKEPIEKAKYFTSLASITLLAKAGKFDASKIKSKLADLVAIRKKAVERMKQIMDDMEKPEVKKSFAEWFAVAKEEWHKARTAGAKDKQPRKRRGGQSKPEETEEERRQRTKDFVADMRNPAIGRSALLRKPGEKKEGEEICEECGHPWNEHKHGEHVKNYPDYEPDRDIEFNEAGEPYYKSRTKGAKDKVPRKKKSGYAALKRVKPPSLKEWNEGRGKRQEERLEREARIRSGDYSPEDWEAHEDDLRDMEDWREKSLSKGEWKPFKQWKKEQEEKKNGKGKDKDAKKSLIDPAVKEEWWKKARTVGAKDKQPRKKKGTSIYHKDGGMRIERGIGKYESRPRDVKRGRMLMTSGGKRWHVSKEEAKQFKKEGLPDWARGKKGGALARHMEKWDVPQV